MKIDSNTRAVIFIFVLFAIGFFLPELFVKLLMGFCVYIIIKIIIDSVKNY